MKKENYYNFEIRKHLTEFSPKNFYRIRKYPLNPFTSGKIKSVLSKKNIGNAHSPLNSREGYTNRLTGEKFLRVYQRITGDVYSKNFVEVVKSILNYAGEIKVDFVRIEKKNPNNLEKTVKEWEWNEGVLFFKDYLKNKEIVMPKELREYKLFADSINKRD